MEKINNWFIMQIILGLLFALFLGIIFYFFIIPKKIQMPESVLSSTFEKPQNISAHSLLPIVSNQWYSSLYGSFPSSPLYAMPLAFKVTKAGLGFSYPELVKNSNSIFAPYKEDFSLGFVDSMDKVRITSISDWMISGKMSTNADKSIIFSMGHGIPFSVLYPDEGTVQITFKGKMKIARNNKAISDQQFAASNFMTEINGHYYIFVFSKDTLIKQENNIIQVENPNRIFVGLLDSKENYDLFLQNANVDIVDTQVSPSIDSNLMTTTYQILSNNGNPVLLALYPHQFDFLSAQQQVFGTYHTLRGELRLIKTNSFSTSMPVINPSGTFTALSKDYPDLKAQIIKDSNEIIKNGVPGSKDYYLGVWFGKVTNLILLADTFGLDQQKKELIDFVEPIFLKSLEGFSYDRKKKSLIAKYPEFGNENLNDHHFHYGYYIRTAAVLSSFDLSYLQKTEKLVNQMVTDIGNNERSSSVHPFLRNFDIYEGHSWADGLGDTDDGNNQESSSEAINAWYGLYLWSKVVNDPNLQKYAVYLYNTEIIAAKYYWFDIKNMYSSPYRHSIASIVWGGKVDFATWFSPDTNMKYGIELLPFTPGSDYLGSLSSFNRFESDYHASSGSEDKPWGDLFLMWKSYYQPEEVLKEKNKIKKVQDGNSLSLFLYTLYKNYENKKLVDKVTK